MSKAKSKSSWKLSEFVAHGSMVNCLCLSPSNGRMLATGGDDRRINLWVIGKPNAITSISGITSPIQSVAFNNSENWIGSGSKSGVIKVFDLDVNKVIRSISAHKAAICSLDFHRFGDILASGSMDTNLKLWDARRKGCIFTYKGHSEVINSVQFSPDGKWVVSASSDSSIKLWDLSAGRLLTEFKGHKGSVTSTRFHPKEFLLASGSSDRTAKIWDLESFQLLAEPSPEANTVGSVLFHLEGTVLFSGSQDSLKVHGWEPVTLHDNLSLRWGRVADMAVYDNQLIGASFAQTNVSLWCVNIKTLRPFLEDDAPLTQPAARAPPLSSSGRRHFEYEQQEVQPPPVQRPHTQPSSQTEHGNEEAVSSSSSSEEVSKEASESPPTQLKDEERREIFATRQRLMRTPPKHQNAPFQPPPGAGAGDEEATPPHCHDDHHHPQPHPQEQYSHTPHPSRVAAASELNKVQILQVHSSDSRAPSERDSRPPLPPSSSASASSSSEEPQPHINLASRLPAQRSNVAAVVGQARQGGGGGGEGGGEVRGSRHQQQHQQHHRQVLDPQPRKPGPSRGIIEQFLPPSQASKPRRVGGGLQSESKAALRDITTNHSDVYDILKNRHEVLKEIRAEWSVSEPKRALEVAVNSGNASALVDILNLLHLKRTLWTLEMSLLVLPELHSLISSRHSFHVKCACKVVKLILKSFGPVIKTNMATPPARGGVDITREERYERCLTCHSHLVSLRGEATRLVRDTPSSFAGKVIREQNLLSSFAILD